MQGIRGKAVGGLERMHSSRDDDIESDYSHYLIMQTLISVIKKEITYSNQALQVSQWLQKWNNALHHAKTWYRHFR